VKENRGSDWLVKNTLQSVEQQLNENASSAGFNIDNEKFAYAENSK